MPKAHKYRNVIKKLKKYDSRFEIYINRAKGSERMIYHPDIKGNAKSFPITCHGNNTEIGKGMLKSIIRRFELPEKIFG